MIRKSNSSKEKTEGIKMTCPDQTDYRFPTGNRESAMQQARRILNEKGYNANLVDKD